MDSPQTPPQNPNRGARSILSGLSATLMGMPGDMHDTRIVLNHMVKWTRQYKANPGDLFILARQIVSQVPEKDYWGEAEAVQKWVRDNIRYTRDINGIETLQSPDVTVAIGQGDCDDKALLAGTLLEILGAPVRYVAWAFAGPDQFEHVYVEVRYGVHWLGVETTECVALGWRPESPFKPYVAHV